MEKLLVIDDQIEYLEFLSNALKNLGYDVKSANSPVVGLEMFVQEHFDLVLSDLKMEVMDGIRLAATIKSMNKQTKVIILTANPTEETEISALDVKVDQYISKDKSIEVIRRYIENVLNQKKEDEFGKQLQLFSTPEQIVMNLVEHTVYKQGEQIQLTLKEFQLLKFFLENKNIALSREMIINAVWEENYIDVDERVVDVHVKKLRNKLKAFSIMSLRGLGYKWNE